MKALRPINLLLLLLARILIFQPGSMEASDGFRYRFGDLVVTELMADPEPLVGLPVVEYVELFNRSGNTISLLGWKFIHGDKSCLLPDYSLKPGAYVVLFEGRDAEPLGQPALSVPSFPALVNAGRLTALTDPEGRCIACIEYSATWYGSTFKSEGGWSLECIDPDNLSGKAANWTASVDPSGGTPGRQNSVSGLLPEEARPYCRCLYVPDAATIELHFDRFMNPECLSDSYCYGLEPQETLVLKALPHSIDLCTVQLALTDTLRSEVDYRLKLSGMRDVNGLDLPDTILVFGKPEKPVTGSLLFNEVLFNPLPGGCDYVELFVADNRWMDLSELILTNRSATGSLNKGVRLTTKPLPARPGSYWLLSESHDTVCRNGEFSPMPHSIDLSEFPSLPDDAGNLCLITIQALQVDAMDYSENMHFSLLEAKEGVALEKRSPQLESRFKKHWTSASSTVQFGTPGFRNSQCFDQEGAAPAGDSDFIRLDRAWLTPDNNGSEDAVVVTCSLKESSVLALKVYNLSGRLVKTLANEALAGASSVFVWDGTTDAGSMAPAGRYLLVARAFSPGGLVTNSKKVVSVLF